MLHSLCLPVGVGHEAGDEDAGPVQLARPQQTVEVLLQLVGVRAREVELDLQAYFTVLKFVKCNSQVCV